MPFDLGEGWKLCSYLGRDEHGKPRLIRQAERHLITKENVKTLELDGNHLFTHFKNLNSRLKRLKTLLHIAREKLSTN